MADVTAQDVAGIVDFVRPWLQFTAWSYQLFHIEDAHGAVLQQDLTCGTGVREGVATTPSVSGVIPKTL